MGGTGRRFRNIGFISTRIAGTDGVSLEVEKWASVLERNGFECFYFSGENDRPPDRCMEVEESHFLHPEILRLQESCYGRRIRDPKTTLKIHELREHLKASLYEFRRRFDLDLVIAENALAIPLNIPLGLALTEFIAETGCPALGHHHDFAWERERFLINAVGDYLCWAFPPNLPTIQHAVINSLASAQLSYRKGLSNTVIPNVYNFARPPRKEGVRSRELREAVGLGEEDLFILQPTRVIPRKWIERSIEIVHLLEPPQPVLVLTHSAQDEGDIYHQRILEYAENLGVRLVSIEHLVGPEDNYGNHDAKRFSIGDVYQAADLVCYPSGYEGFGNAFLEAIYYCRPIVVNRYSIYIADIEPKGFDVIAMEGFVTQETVQKIRSVLLDGERRRNMVEKNYALGREYFSYEVLEELLLHKIHFLETQWGQGL